TTSSPASRCRTSSRSPRRPPSASTSPPRRPRPRRRPRSERAGVRSFAPASLRRYAVRAGAALQVLLLLAASLVLGLAAVAARAQDVLPVPALTARVIDQTGTLGPQRDALDAKLAAFEQEAGPQIVILMVPTTRPEDIAAYAYRVADTWKIGRRDVGDG